MIRTNFQCCAADVTMQIPFGTIAHSFAAQGGHIYPALHSMAELNFSSQLLVIPFILQMICMGFDELFFHRQRSLSRWERIGHPLDTVTVLLCFGWVIANAPTRSTMVVYLLLATFSCFFITKDEKIHREECPAAEHWLHAVLFILHPVILICIGLLWPALHGRSSAIISFSGWERNFLLGNFVLTILFGLFQLVYWNLYAIPRSNK